MIVDTLNGDQPAEPLPSLVGVLVIVSHVGDCNISTLPRLPVPLHTDRYLNGAMVPVVKWFLGLRRGQ